MFMLCSTPHGLRKVREQERLGQYRYRDPGRLGCIVGNEYGKLLSDWAGKCALTEAIPNLDWFAKILGHVLTFGTIAVLLSWFSAILGAALTFLIRRDHGYRKTFWNFLRFTFPAEILRNRSCRLDLFFAIATKMVAP